MALDFLPIFAAENVPEALPNAPPCVDEAEAALDSPQLGVVWGLVTGLLDNLAGIEAACRKRVESEPIEDLRLRLLDLRSDFEGACMGIPDKLHELQYADAVSGRAMMRAE